MLGVHRILGMILALALAPVALGFAPAARAQDLRAPDPGVERERQRAQDRAERQLRRGDPEEAALSLTPLLGAAVWTGEDARTALLLGRALVGLALPHLAIGVLEPLAVGGPERPEREEALELLLDQVQAVDDTALYRELSLRVPVDRWPAAHRERLHLARGYALMQQGEWTLAQLHFEAVETPGLLRAQADFLTGVSVARKDRLMSAVRAFRQVDLGTRGLTLPQEEQPLLDRLRDLALVNIGHIYYGMGRYDGSAGYYAEPGEGSSARESARLGLAWTRFMLYDLPGARRALRGVREVPAPRQGLAQAEADLLEALVSFQACDGERTRRDLMAFERRWGAQHRGVAGLLGLDALEVWEVFFPAAGLMPLEGPLRQEVLQDTDLARVRANLGAVRAERDRAKALSRRWVQALGPWADTALESEEVRYRQVGGDLVRTALRRSSDTLQALGHEGSWTLMSIGDALWAERCVDSPTRPVLSTLLDPP